MTKYILSAVIALSGLSFSAMAADAENSEKATVDHSKNPVTGTKKTTVTHKSKHKNEDGSESKMKRKDTTKETTDGKTEKSTETKTDSESK
jgi:hypothetical protein